MFSLANQSAKLTNVNAALWLRREAGDSACDMVIWVEPVTTFKEGS